MIQPINSKPFLTPINFLSMTCGESFIKNQNNLKNRFFAASSLSQNFDAHSSLASRQWSLAPHQNYEEPPCQIPDSSGCFGIYPPEIKPSEVKSQDAIQNASPTQQAPTLDQKMVDLWKKFGWTSAWTNPKNKSAKLRDLSSLLVLYPDLVQFLRKSGLLYTIRGFQNTLDQANGTIPPNASKIQTGIRLDYDGHPLLLKEGNWERWEVIKKIICYDPKKKKLVSVSDQKKEWNYFYPQGLCQKSRYGNVFPVYKLTSDDMEILQKHSEEFFNKKIPPALKNDRKNWHYIQVFSSENFFIPSLSHVSLRLIDKMGQVHSLGFEIDPNDSQCSQKVFFLRTCDVGINSLDYDEFQTFDKRRVTTIPLTEEQYKNALQKVKDYASRPLRFNRFHQNCVAYTISILRAAGHPIDVRCTFIDGLLDLIPRPKDLSFIGPAIDKVQKCTLELFHRIEQCIPFFVKIIPSALWSVIAAIKTKIYSIFTNLIGLLFGNTQASPSKNVAVKSIDNKHDLMYFNVLIQGPTDILRNEPAAIYSPVKLVNWQLDQKSTYIHKFDGCPKLAIVPQ